MRYIRVQLEERQTVFDKPYRLLKRFKSQSDITSLSFNRNRVESIYFKLFK